MDKQKTCDLCGGERFEIICRRDRRGKPLNTVACLGCGLVGHKAVPTEAELAAFYASHYREEYHGESRPSNRRIWRAQLKGERILNQLRPHLQPGARVFEVGAGIGCNVKAFECTGFDASGIEPGNAFQGFSQNELQAQVRHCSLADYEVSERFDVVLFVHVIEHMRSPRQSLQAIRRLLKPGGLLYLECPSLGKPCGTIAELFHFAHIHTFTPLTLLTLLRQCGFAVEKCFSDGIGRNHKFLLRKTEAYACPIDPAGLAQTREFLERFPGHWHRFGPRYVAGRIKRVFIYLKEFIWGKQAVRRLLREHG